MKIIGFAQLRNEKEKGNLLNWHKCMELLCDHIYIYDQNSDDGSREFYKQYDNIITIESSTNDFANEITCKSKLLKKVLKDHPNTDWILWLDGDTMLENKLLDRNILEKFLTKCASLGYDGVSLGHYNLWRSDIHYRVDNQYDFLHKTGVVAFWKNNGHLVFPQKPGLHGRQYPNGVGRIFKSKLSLIHRGFATDSQIINRYKTYKDRGQSGWALDRLIDETTLKVEQLESSRLPSWFEIEKEDTPTNLKKIMEIMNDKEEY